MKVAVSIHSPTGAQEPNLATLTSFMNAAKQFAIMEIKIQLMMSALMALIPHAVITQNSKLAHLPSVNQFAKKNAAQNQQLSAQITTATMTAVNTPQATRSAVVQWLIKP